MYFCAVKKKEQKSKKIEWQSIFGSTKDNYLLMFRSNQPIMQVANFFSQLYQKDFSFLTNYAVNEERQDLTFPVYFVQLKPSEHVYMTLFSNITTVDPNNAAEQADPLLGLFMFEEEYYVFNNQGRREFDCPYKDYDYLLLISCDNDTSIQDYLEPLSEIPSMCLQDVSEMMNVRTKKDQQRVSFIQNLFNGVEIMINEFEEDHLNAFLGDKTGIDPVNYSTNRIPRANTVTSLLLYREDV